MMPRALEWVLDQPIMVRYAILLPPLVVAGLVLWAAFAPGNRLMRRAERAVRQALDASRGDGPAIRAHEVAGVLGVSPGALAVMFFYVDDAALAAARASGATARIEARVREALLRERYPAEPASVSFISDEEVERAGGPMHYFR